MKKMIVICIGVGMGIALTMLGGAAWAGRAACVDLLAEGGAKVASRAEAPLPLLLATEDHVVGPKYELVKSYLRYFFRVGFQVPWSSQEGGIIGGSDLTVMDIMDARNFNKDPLVGALVIQWVLYFAGRSPQVDVLPFFRQSAVREFLLSGYVLPESAAAPGAQDYLDAGLTSGQLFAELYFSPHGAYRDAELNGFLQMFRQIYSQRSYNVFFNTFADHAFNFVSTRSKNASQLKNVAICEAIRARFIGLFEGREHLDESLLFELNKKGELEVYLIQFNNWSNKVEGEPFQYTITRKAVLHPATGRTYYALAWRTDGQKHIARIEVDHVDVEDILPPALKAPKYEELMYGNQMRGLITTFGMAKQNISRALATNYINYFKSKGYVFTKTKLKDASALRTFLHEKISGGLSYFIREGHDEFLLEYMFSLPQESVVYSGRARDQAEPSIFIVSLKNDGSDQPGHVSDDLQNVIAKGIVRTYFTTEELHTALMNRKQANQFLYVDSACENAFNLSQMIPFVSAPGFTPIASNTIEMTFVGDGKSSGVDLFLSGLEKRLSYKDMRSQFKKLNRSSGLREADGHPFRKQKKSYEGFLFPDDKDYLNRDFYRRELAGRARVFYEIQIVKEAN